ncbi:spore coat polysaccharide biosynthesis protein SpsF [Alkalibacillus flavidus]|uniref:Spore coat polysaccharide biosynthesis protein SpsF n=1 Tax=Alkalibacillus flavidus TaxID=546021 RepID=A0ABV2KTR9_9BACI
MTVGVVIQARMGSTRLPGKVLKDLKGQTVLAHVVERVNQASCIDQIIVATTDLPEDDAIVDEVNRLNTMFFRGSEHNVLSRYAEAAKTFDLDTVVRITSDCPLIDPCVLDQLIQYYHDSSAALVTNAGPYEFKRTYPRGFDVEVFSNDVLQEANQYSTENYQREHVTPYIYEDKHDVAYYQLSDDWSHYRLTLDTQEDFDVIKLVYDHLYQGRHDFYLADIIRLLKAYPKIAERNQHIEQKKLTE